MSLLIKLKQTIEPVLDDMGVELVEATLLKKSGRFTLYIAVDTEGGIDLEKLSQVNRKLSASLDDKDLIKGRYDLEVSSPGIDRPLTKPAHYIRFIGNEAKIRTKIPIKDRKNFKGIIKDAGEDKVKLALDDKTVEIRYEDISKANLIANIKF